MSILTLESAGFAAPRHGVAARGRGPLALDGDLPIATFGGLKARGHPVGATGCYQLVEAYLQLTERAARIRFATRSSRSSRTSAAPARPS